MKVMKTFNINFSKIKIGLTFLNIVQMIIFFMLINVANAQTDSSITDKPCIIFPKGGKQIKATRIWKIESGNIEYESDGSLHDYPIEEVEKIKFGTKEYIFVSDTLFPLLSEVPRDSSHIKLSEGEPKKYGPFFDYAALGRTHADAHCSPVGGIMAGIFGGPTIIIPIIVAATPPNPQKKNIPDLQLYKGVPEYRKAFNRKVHQKKAIGVAIGVTGFLVTAAMISSAL